MFKQLIRGCKLVPMTALIILLYSRIVNLLAKDRFDIRSIHFAFNRYLPSARLTRVRFRTCHARDTAPEETFLKIIILGLLKRFQTSSKKLKVAEYKISSINIH